MSIALIIAAAALAWFACGALYGKKRYSSMQYDAGWNDCRKSYSLEVLLLRSQVRNLKRTFAQRRQKALHQKRDHGRFAA